MHLRAGLVLSTLLAASASASARADAPWSAPAPIDGISSPTALLTTQIGGRILIGASSRRSLAAPTVVARLRPDGSASREQTLDVAYARAAGYAQAGIVVAGSRPAPTSGAAARAPVVVMRGSIRGTHGVEVAQALPGSAGQVVLAAAGNPRSDQVAVVTGSLYEPGPPTQTVWLRHGKRFARAITVAVGTSTRDATAAVGADGDVLVAWQGAHRTVYARHFGRTGRPGPVHRVGAGVQSSLQARVDDDGRLEVAWESQRVGEGDVAHSAASVAYASAAPGRGFALARVLGGRASSAAGRFVPRPGLRLVATGPRTSLLAWTRDDGAHLRVQIADAASGAVGAPQTISPPGQDAVLGDAASSAVGGQLVVWSTTSGADPRAPVPVLAASRPAGASAFDAAQIVTSPAGSLPQPPSALVDARTGLRLVALSTLQQQTEVASRVGG